uniref:SCP domain-containing protein n=1 Tax=Gouania willdenowi TaxID=441366 RepID=A0A8C5E1J7_GOUWI
QLYSPKLLYVFADYVPPFVSLHFQTEIVNKHNTLRRGVSPSASNMLKMSWNREASANAQRWANKCIIKHSPPSKRKISTSGCGENIYMSSKKDTWSEAIQSWYDEEKNWRYGVGSVNGGEVGHFTQLVWYKSNQIGCAMAHCPNAGYKYFYVCHYCPPSLALSAGPTASSGPGAAYGFCSSGSWNHICHGRTGLGLWDNTHTGLNHRHVVPKYLFYVTSTHFLLCSQPPSLFLSRTLVTRLA